MDDQTSRNGTRVNEIRVQHAMLKDGDIIRLGGTHILVDLPKGSLKLISALRDADPAYIGLNHLGWIQDVKVEGRSCMGALLERLERHKNDGFNHELIELFRMIPTRTVSLFFGADEVLKKQQAKSLRL